MEPVSPEVETWCLNHWTARDVPGDDFFKSTASPTKREYRLSEVTGKNGFYRFCRERTELSRGHSVQGSGKTTHILNVCHNRRRSHNVVSKGKDTSENPGTRFWSLTR